MAGTFRNNNGTIENLSGGTTVDAAFSDTSENPVQNKVITEELNSCLRLKQVRQVILATADGVKTMGTLLAEALTNFRQLTPLYRTFSVQNFRFPRGVATSKAQLLPTGNDVPTSNFSTSNIGAFSTYRYSNNIVTYAVNISDNGAAYSSVTVTSDSVVVFTNLTDIVPVSDSTFTVYLNEYA